MTELTPVAPLTPPLTEQPDPVPKASEQPELFGRAEDSHVHARECWTERTSLFSAQYRVKRSHPGTEQQDFAKRSCHAWPLADGQPEWLCEQAEAVVDKVSSIGSLEGLRDSIVEIIDNRIFALRCFAVTVFSSAGHSKRIDRLQPEVKISALINKIAMAFHKRPTDIKLCLADSVISHDPDATLAAIGIHEGSQLTMVVAISPMGATQKQALQDMIDRLYDEDLEDVFTFLESRAGIPYPFDLDDVNLDLDELPPPVQQELLVFVSQRIGARLRRNIRTGAD